jgi:hypothetical protein
MYENKSIEELQQLQSDYEKRCQTEDCCFKTLGRLVLAIKKIKVEILKRKIENDKNTN